MLPSVVAAEHDLQRIVDVDPGAPRSAKRVRSLVEEALALRGEFEAAEAGAGRKAKRQKT